MPPVGSHESAEVGQERAIEQGIALIQARVRAAIISEAPSCGRPWKVNIRVGWPQ